MQPASRPAATPFVMTERPHFNPKHHDAPMPHKGAMPHRMVPLDSIPDPCYAELTYFEDYSVNAPNWYLNLVSLDANGNEYYWYFDLYTNSITEICGTYIMESGEKLEAGKIGTDATELDAWEGGVYNEKDVNTVNPSGSVTISHDNIYLNVFISILYAGDEEDYQRTFRIPLSMVFAVNDKDDHDMRADFTDLPLGEPVASEYLTLHMFDTYGDAWNGNAIIVKHQAYGVEKDTFSLVYPNGDYRYPVHYGSVRIPRYDNEQLSLYWIEGSFSAEVDYLLVADDQTLLASNNFGGMSGYHTGDQIGRVSNVYPHTDLSISNLMLDPKGENTLATWSESAEVEHRTFYTHAPEFGSEHTYILNPGQPRTLFNHTVDGEYTAAVVVEAIDHVAAAQVRTFDLPASPEAPTNLQVALVGDSLVVTWEGNAYKYEVEVYDNYNLSYSNYDCRSNSVTVPYGPDALPYIEVWVDGYDATGNNNTGGCSFRDYITRNTSSKTFQINVMLEKQFESELLSVEDQLYLYYQTYDPLADNFTEFITELNPISGRSQWYSATITTEEVEPFITVQVVNRDVITLGDWAGSEYSTKFSHVVGDMCLYVPNYNGELLPYDCNGKAIDYTVTNIQTTVGSAMVHITWEAVTDAAHYYVVLLDNTESTLDVTITDGQKEANLFINSFGTDLKVGIVPFDANMNPLTLDMVYSELFDYDQTEPISDDIHVRVLVNGGTYFSTLGNVHAEVQTLPLGVPVITDQALTYDGNGWYSMTIDHTLITDGATAVALNLWAEDEENATTVDAPFNGMCSINEDVCLKVNMASSLLTVQTMPAACDETYKDYTVRNIQATWDENYHITLSWESDADEVLMMYELNGSTFGPIKVQGHSLSIENNEVAVLNAMIIPTAAAGNLPMGDMAEFTDTIAPAMHDIHVRIVLPENIHTFDAAMAQGLYLYYQDVLTGEYDAVKLTRVSSRQYETTISARAIYVELDDQPYATIYVACNDIITDDVVLTLAWGQAFNESTTQLVRIDAQCTPDRYVTEFNAASSDSQLSLNWLPVDGAAFYHVLVDGGVTHNLEVCTTDYFDDNMIAGDYDISISAAIIAEDGNVYYEPLVFNHHIYVTSSYLGEWYDVCIYAEEHGSVSTNGGTHLLEGSTVTVVATPEDGYRFAGWSNGVTTPTLNLVVSSDTTVAALFEPSEVKLTLLSGEGGSVSGSGTYAYGSSVTFSATPAAGYEFEGWSDGSTDATRIIILTDDITLSASFKQVMAITTVSAELDINAPAYNVLGQRVDARTYKGVVIQDQHKFLR